jgi:hypothetical protein
MTFEERERAIERLVTILMERAKITERFGDKAGLFSRQSLVELLRKEIPPADKEA